MKKLIFIILTSLTITSCAPLIIKPLSEETWIKKSTKKDKNPIIVTIIDRKNGCTVYNLKGEVKDTSTKSFVKLYMRYSLSGYSTPSIRYSTDH